MLGLALRAGKLVTGEEQTLKEIRSNKAKLVILAHDTGINTTKKITDKCKTYGIPCVTEFFQTEISQALGRQRTVVAICDQGFASKIQELMNGIGR